MAFLHLNIRGRLVLGFSVLCVLLAAVVGTTIPVLTFILGLRLVERVSELLAEREKVHGQATAAAVERRPFAIP